MGTVFKTLYPKVAENEIEKLRKKDTFTVIRYTWSFSDDNVHEYVLTFEMTAIEPGENLTRTLTWKPLDFHNHIKFHTNDDRFPLSLWEVRFYSSLDVPIPDLIGPPQ